MATKFLDYTGLSYLWSKIKEWCNSIFVTKTTDENITGTKTFLGSKKIVFKQSGANDKLGFTLYNNSSKEQGYLEYNPTNKIANVPLFTLGNYATAANELTYIGFRRYSNISGASGAYNLLAPLISDAKTPFNLTTTYTNFYLPLGISDGTSIVTASNSGVIDISSFLTLTGYTKPSTGSALAATDTIIEALGKLEAKVDGSVTDYYDMTPVGSIFYFAADTAPSGYLVCNGNAVSRTTYSALFNVIGTTYGTGDGSTTFNLPNLIDKFAEGANSNIGDSVDAGLPNITGYVGGTNTASFSPDVQSGALFSSGSYSYVSSGASGTGNLNLNIDASRSNLIYGASSTVQPPAVKLLPCIKAYNVVSNSNSIDISSLESELIDNVVHRTGSEVINGYKIFTDNIALHRDFTKGDIPSSNIFWSIIAGDKYGTDYPAHRIGGVETIVTTAGTNITHMYSMQNVAGNVDVKCELGVYIDINGNSWTYAPTPVTNDNSTKIATTAFVKAQGYLTSHQTLPTLSKTDSGSGNAVTAISVSGHTITVTKGSTFLTSHQSLANYVTLTGTQTLTNKTFGNKVKLYVNNNYVPLDFVHFNYNVTSPSTSESSFQAIYFSDKNDVWAGRICHETTVTSSSVHDNKLRFHLKQRNSSGNTACVNFVFSNNNAISIYPENADTRTVGTSGHKWSTVYATTGTIQTSDIRLKSYISEIPNEVLDAWEELIFYQFKFNDAIEQKGENARLHNGLIAQYIDNIFKKHSLDATKYGLFCYDSWEAEPKKIDDDGSISSDGLEAGNQYSIRYEEALCMEAAYQRRKNKILENRISELERQVSDMLQILQSLKGAN